MSVGISPPCSYLQVPSPHPESLLDITGPSHSCFTIVFIGVWVKLETAVCTFLKIAVHQCPSFVLHWFHTKDCFSHQDLRKETKESLTDPCSALPVGPQRCIKITCALPNAPHHCYPSKVPLCWCLNPLPQTSFSTDEFTPCSLIPIFSLCPLLPSSSFPHLSHHLLRHCYAPSLRF